MTSDEARLLRYMQRIYYDDGGGRWLDFIVLRYNENNNEVEGFYWTVTGHYGYQNMMMGSYPLDKLRLP